MKDKLSYMTKTNDETFTQETETPVNVGFVLHVRKNTKSKTGGKNLQTCIWTLLQKSWKLGQANSVFVCHHGWSFKDAFLWFAMKNIDFL